MEKHHTIAIMAAILYGSHRTDGIEVTVNRAYNLYDEVIEQAPEVREAREIVKRREAWREL